MSTTHSPSVGGDSLGTAVSKQRWDEVARRRVEREREEIERRQTALREQQERADRLNVQRDAERRNRIRLLQEREAARQRCARDRREAHDAAMRREMETRSRSVTAESRGGNAMKLSRPSFAFGSSTPRELAYLQNLNREQKIYDRPLANSQTRGADGEVLMTRSVYTPPRTAPAGDSPGTGHVTSARVVASPARSAIATRGQGARKTPNAMTQSLYSPTGQLRANILNRKAPPRVIASPATTPTAGRSPVASARKTTTPVAGKTSHSPMSGKSALPPRPVASASAKEKQVTPSQRRVVTTAVTKSSKSPMLSSVDCESPARATHDEMTPTGDRETNQDMPTRSVEQSTSSEDTGMDRETSGHVETTQHGDQSSEVHVTVTQATPDSEMIPLIESKNDEMLPEAMEEGTRERMEETRRVVNEEEDQQQSVMDEEMLISEIPNPFDGVDETVEGEEMRDEITPTVKSEMNGGIVEATTRDSPHGNAEKVAHDPVTTMSNGTTTSSDEEDKHHDETQKMSKEMTDARSTEMREREERRARLAAIMSRTRAAGGASASNAAKPVGDNGYVATSHRNGDEMQEQIAGDRTRESEKVYVKVPSADVKISLADELAAASADAATSIVARVNGDSATGDPGDAHSFLHTSPAQLKSDSNRDDAMMGNLMEEQLKHLHKEAGMASGGVDSSSHRLLSDLRVIELKQELDKRGLDKSGVKAKLIERLEEAIRGEGLDPMTYLFAVEDATTTTSTTGNLTNRVPIKSHQTHTTTSNSTGLVEDKKNVGSHELAIVGSGENTIIHGGNEMAKEMNDGDEDGRRSTTISEQMMDTNNGVMDDEEEDDVEMPEATAGHEEEEEDMADKEQLDYHHDDELDREDETTTSAASIAAASAQRVSPKNASGKDGGLASGKSNEENAPDFTGRSLWVKGLSNSTKAAELKAACMKFGRVVTAKIYTNKKQPHGNCLGHVTMFDAEMATLCMQKMHRSIFKGQMVIVEKTCDKPDEVALKRAVASIRSSPKTPIKSSASPKTAVTRRDTKSDGKDDASGGDDHDKSGKSGDEKKRTAIREVRSASSTGDRTKEGSSTRSSHTVKTSSSSRRDPGPLPTRDLRRNVRAPVSSYRHRGIAPPARSSTHSRGYHSVSSVGYQRAGASYPPRGGSSGYPSRSGTSGYRGRGGPPWTTMRGMIRPPSGGPPMSGGLTSRSSMMEFDRRQMMEMMRRKEEEHRKREEELRLEREREHIKFEREKLARERMEVEHMKQMAALAAMQPAMRAAPATTAVAAAALGGNRFASPTTMAMMSSPPPQAMLGQPYGSGSSLEDRRRASEYGSRVSGERERSAHASSDRRSRHEQRGSNNGGGGYAHRGGGYRGDDRRDTRGSSGDSAASLRSGSWTAPSRAAATATVTASGGYASSARQSSNMYGGGGSSRGGDYNSGDGGAVAWHGGVGGGGAGSSNPSWGGRSGGDSWSSSIPSAYAPATHDRFDAYNKYGGGGGGSRRY